MRITNLEAKNNLIRSKKERKKGKVFPAYAMEACTG